MTLNDRMSLQVLVLLQGSAKGQGSDLSNDARGSSTGDECERSLALLFGANVPPEVKRPKKHPTLPLCRASLGRNP